MEKINTRRPLDSYEGMPQYNYRPQMQNTYSRFQGSRPRYQYSQCRYNRTQPLSQPSMFQPSSRVNVSPCSYCLGQCVDRNRCPAKEAVCHNCPKIRHYSRAFRLTRLSHQYYRFPLLELFKLEARFVLRPGQHVNNMEENTNYRSLQCYSLGQILKILKVGRGCSNVGQPSTKCFEQTTLRRLSSLGSTFNRSRLSRSSHFLRALSTFGNLKKTCIFVSIVRRTTNSNTVSNRHLAFTILFTRCCGCPGYLARFVPLSTLLRKSALRTITRS